MTLDEFERMLFDLNDSSDISYAALSALSSALDQVRAQLVKDDNENLVALKESLREGVKSAVLAASESIRTRATVHEASSEEWEAGGWWGAEHLEGRIEELIEDL